jgi:transcriptional regulator with XRE-family HTH domain
MEPKQSAMARVALGWTLSDLAKAAGVGRATAARFELGEPVSDALQAKLERALSDAGVEFSQRAGRVGVTVPA